jgi:4-aminobutyrate aminotransferase-like enzyme
MIGAEFVCDRRKKTRAPELRNDVIQGAFESGLLVIPCGPNAIRFTPPLNIPQTLVDEGLGIFETALTEAEARHL